eukprot:Gb_12438 [translate_table: standard]
MCYTAGRPLPRSDEEGGKSQEQTEDICNGSTLQSRDAASAYTMASKKIGGWRSMPFIFANELCKKLAVVGFSANMITYLTEELHLPLVKAANTLTNFGGTASLTPLLGAFIADAYIGRFWTIAVASIIYQIVVSGMIALTLSAVLPQLRPPPCKIFRGETICKESTSAQLAILYISLLLTAIGAVTVIVYVQDNIGWGWGLGIPSMAMAFSIVAFLRGFPLYRHFKPSGSPMTRLLQVIVASIRKRNIPKPTDPGSLYQDKEKDLAISPGGCLTHTNQFTFLDRAAIPMHSDTVEGASSPSVWRLCSVHQVEELKSIIRIVPIWSSGIVLATAAAQQNTFSIMQARTMKRDIAGSASFHIPPGSMTVFTILSMLITISLYDRIFMPIARRFTGRGRGISFLQRMGIGFVVSVAATLVAGFVEIKRKNVAAQHGLLDRPKSTIPMTVFWLVPQYSLHGIAEAFMSIGHLEFFYDQSPESMRSTAAALFWTSISAGSYLSSFLVSIVHNTTGRHGRHNWLPTNLNRGRLEYLYWLITLLQILNFVYYLICAHWYTYKPIVHETLDHTKTSTAEEAATVDVNAG